MLPTIKKTMEQAQEAFSKVDTKVMTNKLHQAVNFMKKKMQDLKKSSENNEISIKVNNKDAQKQITQIEKEIDSLQKKITGRQLKLDVTNNALDKIRNDTNQSVIKEMPDAGNKRITQETYKRLDSNTNYQSLVKQSDKLNSEIEKYNALLNSAKSKMVELGQRTSKTSTTQNKLSSFFGAFKQKVEQTKPSIASMKDSFNSMPKITQNITNNINGMGTKLKSGLGHILKYAGALFSMQSIYSTLSSCASTWLSSQNAGAQQLSANIEYMKYAMGSVFAPVIQYVTSLVYQLMKAIQSVAYALTGVNIFAKASAKSYSAMAGSAKKAKQETKQLAGVHDEINNVQSNNNSDNGSGEGSAPSFDLSKINNTPNSIIEAIKKGDWYQVGVELGNKLNEAMNNIPWDKIQNTARNIGTNIAQFLNGFIATTNWSQVGNTFAQGLNTIIYFGYSFITTFDWKKFGSAISESINGFFKNVDWKAIGETCTEGINGLLDVIIGALSNLEWGSIVDALINYFEGIDFSAVTNKFFEMLGTSLGSFAKLLEVLDSKKQELIEGIKNWFSEKVEECGGNIVAGILKGVVDALLGIGQWIIDNIFTPFIEGFKNAFGIHSPSTVMEEQGNFIMQGLLNGITSLVENVKQIWENIKNTAIEKFTDIKNSISNVWQQVTNKTSETWQNIKNKVKEGAQGAWNGITSIFGNIPNWFRDKFSQAWQAVKNVFSTGGRIFDGIKDGILSGLKSIVNAIINGINKVISIPFNGLNSALRTIKNAEIMGMRPFSWISTVQIPQIPRLAKGGVLYDETLVMAGEYSGAKTNPEIVTPQNIMYDTMRRALLDADIGNDNDTPINLTINVGNTKLGQILLDNLRDIKRQSGKDLEALVGG